MKATFHMLIESVLRGEVRKKILHAFIESELSIYEPLNENEYE